MVQRERHLQSMHFAGLVNFVHFVGNRLNIYSSVDEMGFIKPCMHDFQKLFGMCVVCLQFLVLNMDILHASLQA